jgi:hypothetical protein
MAKQLKPTMPMRVFALVFGLAGVLDCGPRTPAPPRNLPRDPLFAGLNAPPVNRPLFQFESSPISGNASLPGGDHPALVLVSDGQPVRAVGVLPGMVTARDGRIGFQGTDGTSIDVVYRLPKALTGPPQVDSSGDLSAIDHANKSGDHVRQVLVCSEGSLLLAQIALASPKPVTTELGAGLRLAQRQGSRVTPAGGSAEVVVEAVDEERVVGTIPVGRPTQIRTSTGVFQALVESSRHDSTFTLEAWVVRSRN